MKKLVISAVALFTFTITTSSVYAAIRVANVNSGYGLIVRYTEIKVHRPRVGVAHHMRHPREILLESGEDKVIHWDVDVSIVCVGYHATSFKNPRGKTLNIDYYGICGGAPWANHHPRYYTYYSEDTP